VARLPPAGELTETLENVNVPSFVADRRGTMTWLNRAARGVLGNVVGRSFTEFVAPEYVPVVQRQLERKRQGANVTDYEVEVFGADGRRRRAEVSSVPLRGSDRCHAVFGIALTGPPRAIAATTMLTPRQRQVLELLGQGASTDDIANGLHLSRETVRNHVRHLLRALGAHSRLEAVALAYERGLLQPAEPGGE
jgi:PAS domain S-box-containing protein